MCKACNEYQTAQLSNAHMVRTCAMTAPSRVKMWIKGSRASHTPAPARAPTAMPSTDRRASTLRAWSTCEWHSGVRIIENGLVEQHVQTPCPCAPHAPQACMHPGMGINITFQDKPDKHACNTLRAIPPPSSLLLPLPCLGT